MTNIDDKMLCSIGFAFGKISTPANASNCSTEELITMFSQSTNTLDKLKLCRNFQDFGRCSFGSSCRFSHAESTKQLPCKFYFSTNNCRFGDHCQYSHSKEVLANWLQNSSVSFQKNTLNHTLWIHEKQDSLPVIKKIQVFNFLAKKLIILTQDGRVFFAELIDTEVQYRFVFKEELLFASKEFILDFSCANNIYIGAYALFLAKSGRVYGFGINGFGNLGNGTVVDSWTPTILNPHFPKEVLSKEYNIKSILCGLGHSLFLLSNGVVLSCGNNEQGQVGIGTMTDKVLHVSKIETLESVVITQIATGSDHSLFLTEEGQVYGCGSNKYGEIGLGPQIRRMLIPVAIQTYMDDKNIPIKETPIIKEILCNPQGHFSIFRTQNDEFFVTGKNSYGNLCIPQQVRKQIFYPTKIQFNIPQDYTIEDCFVGKHNFAVVVRNIYDQSIRIYCCGDNDSNQIMMQSNNRRFEDALNVDSLSLFESKRFLPQLQTVYSYQSKWRIQQLEFLDMAMIAVAVLQPSQLLQEKLFACKYFYDVHFVFECCVTKNKT